MIVCSLFVEALIFERCSEDDPCVQTFLLLHYLSFQVVHANKEGMMCSTAVISRMNRLESSICPNSRVCF